MTLMTPPVLTIRLFSIFTVEVGGLLVPTMNRRKSQWLLALLALRQGREVSREWLAETLWPDSDPSRALRNLRQSLSDDLRPTLGAAASLLRTPTKATLCLDASDVWVDTAAFDAALATGTVVDRECAVAFYRGPLLEECLEEWVLPERAARAEAFYGALERLASDALSHGQPGTAAGFLRRLIVASPLRESAHVALMEALAASGDATGVREAYRDLRLLLHRELNAEPSAQTCALYKQLQQASVYPALPPPAQLVPSSSPSSPSAPTRRLPVPLTRLIGRESDITEVVDRLRQGRLVTLTGPGGVGKTRLSIAVAEAVAGTVADGVWFVELARLSDAGLAANALAQALLITEQPGQTIMETLTVTLSTRSLLLILDNCEHLLDACARLVEELLQRCGGVRVLATSREALGLYGEWVYRVQPLEVPLLSKVASTTDEDKNLASRLAEYSAVRLFVECAAQSRSLRLSASTAMAIAEICSQLDGIPLAIEMAAARVRTMSVEQIRSRLSDRFGLLRSGSRTALPRHQTLQALMDWSYDLLESAEMGLLCRLSVFAGGWKLEAAERVCGEGEDVVDLLGSLVDKSLVVFETGTDGVRYRMLETVRQYAWVRLVESGKSDAVRARHSAYFTAFAEEAGRRLTGIGQLEWTQRVEVEYDNLRSAIEWCRNDPEGVEAGLRLTTGMAWFWVTHGYLKEGRQHLTEALARESPSRSKVRCEALMQAGMLACEMGDYAAGQSLYEECLRVRRESGDRQGMVETLTALGLIKHEQGDYQTASAYLEERLAMLQEIGDRPNCANALYWLGRIAEGQGDLAKARLYLEEASAIDLECGQKAGHAQWRLGDVLCMLSDYTAARKLLIEILKAGWEVGDKFLALSVLESLAWFAYSQEQSVHAARLYGAADNLRATFGYTLPPSDEKKYVHRTVTVHAALGEAAFTTPWKSGQEMSMEQAVEYALDIFDISPTG